MIRPSTDWAKVYLRAARIVERGNMTNAAHGYACNAIEVAQKRDPYDFCDMSPATLAFREVFDPGVRGSMTGFFGPMELAINRDRRVLALCFMAAMVEAGDA